MEGGRYLVQIESGSTLDWGQNVINTDPLFVDPDQDDCHLSSESPCIDAGIDAGVYADFEGDSRPQGYDFDMGYDESPYAVPYCLFISPDGPVTVSRGDIFYFSSLIRNNTASEVSGDFWLSIRLPNSNEILIPEDYLNYRNPFPGQIFPDGVVR